MRVCPDSLQGYGSLGYVSVYQSDHRAKEVLFLPANSSSLGPPPQIIYADRTHPRSFAALPLEIFFFFFCLLFGIFAINIAATTLLSQRASRWLPGKVSRASIVDEPTRKPRVEFSGELRKNGPWGAISKDSRHPPCDVYGCGPRVCLNSCC